MSAASRNSSFRRKGDEKNASESADPNALLDAQLAPFIDDVMDKTLGRYQVIQNDPRLVHPFLSLSRSEVQEVLKQVVRHEFTLTAAAPPSPSSHDQKLDELQAAAGSDRRDSAIAGEEGNSVHPSGGAHLKPTEEELTRQVLQAKSSELFLRSIARDMLKEVTAKTTQVEVLKGLIERRDVLLNEQKKAYLKELLHMSEIIRQYRQTGKSTLEDVFYHAWDQDAAAEQLLQEQTEKIDAALNEVREKCEEEKEQLEAKHSKAQEDLKLQITHLELRLRSASAILPHVDAQTDTADDPPQSPIERKDAETLTDETGNSMGTAAAKGETSNPSLLQEGFPSGTGGGVGAQLNVCSNCGHEMSIVSSTEVPQGQEQAVPKLKPVSSFRKSGGGKRGGSGSTPDPSGGGKKGTGGKTSKAPKSPGLRRQQQQQQQQTSIAQWAKEAEKPSETEEADGSVTWATGPADGPQSSLKPLDAAVGGSNSRITPFRGNTPETPEDFSELHEAAGTGKTSSAQKGEKSSSQQQQQQPRASSSNSPEFPHGLEAPPRDATSPSFLEATSALVEIPEPVRRELEAMREEMRRLKQDLSVKEEELAKVNKLKAELQSQQQQQQQQRKSLTGHSPRPPSTPGRPSISSGAGADVDVPVRESDALLIRKLKDELRSKDNIVKKQSEEMAQVQTEMARWFDQYRQTQPSRQAPVNHLAVHNLSLAVSAAEEQEARYRVLSWKLITQLNRFGEVIAAQLQECQEAQDQQNFPLLRRTQYQLDVLKTHARTVITRLRLKRSQSREEANHCWDTVLYFARTVGHGEQPPMVPPRYYSIVYSPSSAAPWEDGGVNTNFAVLQSKTAASGSVLGTQERLKEIIAARNMSQQRTFRPSTHASSAEASIQRTPLREDGGFLEPQGVTNAAIGAYVTKLRGSVQSGTAATKVSSIEQLSPQRENNSARQQAAPEDPINARQRPHSGKLRLGRPAMPPSSTPNPAMQVLNDPRPMSAKSQRPMSAKTVDTVSSTQSHARQRQVAATPNDLLRAQSPRQRREEIVKLMKQDRSELEKEKKAQIEQQYAAKNAHAAKMNKEEVEHGIYKFHYETQ